MLVNNVRDPASMFDWVDAVKAKVNKKMALEAVICTTYWYLWRFRNDVVHESKLIRKDVLFDSIREISFT